MTGSNVDTVHQNEYVSNNDNVPSVEDKKRKIEMIYLSGQWEEVDEYEISKLRQVIRNHIFKHVKFVKGEGAKPCAKKDLKTKKANQLLFGKCHERPDLTKLTGYECQILRMVGLSEIDATIIKQALWWKTYNSQVHKEIRQMRGRMNAAMKTSIRQG